MIRSIAVTTDFSGMSRQAFGVAAELARRFAARLQLVHIAVPATQHLPFFTEWQLPEYCKLEKALWEARLEEKLAELAGQDPAFRGLNVEPLLLKGNLLEICKDFDQHAGTDLVVIATHGYSDLNQFLLGSFASKAMRLISCPVLVYRRPGSGAAPAGALFAPKRILIAYDFSKTSRGAMEMARAWASEFDAMARLLFVVEDTGPAPPAAEKPPALFECQEKVRAEAMAQLEKMARSEWKGLNAEVAVTVGSPASDILREAENFKADLIVLGSQSRIHPFYLGSAAEKTVQGASCPVLVVKE